MIKYLYIHSLMFIIISSLILVELKEFQGNLTKKLDRIHRLHTYYRNSLLLCKVPTQPPADDMAVLRWHPVLAKHAQLVANKCDVTFDLINDKSLEQFESVGQNVAEANSVTSAMENWFREYNNYTYETDKCRGDCSNYRQMVWAKTKFIGCGLNKCNKKLMIVCNYSPSAEDKGRPYEKGDLQMCKIKD
ncbi:Glioma pathogenesis-related protein [Schistosoma japonicum]|uniref:Glioma pathogenesis-related protein n=1 Tax=Schistosoma japonicum TaxID=6182 RepID=A0A4Z2CSH7_SCHJA|nr:Venom allergen 5 [Schistosoma japonicum]TNN06960.1 Glioma pathogenesis-related protein [Schistosoma japonicum]